MQQHCIYYTRSGRVSECSCFGEVTLTEIKLLVSDASPHALQRNHLFQNQSCTHKLSCLLYECRTTRTQYIANNKQMRFHINAVKAQVLRVLLTILSVIYNVKRDVCALHLHV